MGKIARIKDNTLYIKGVLIEEDLISKSYGFIEQNGLLVVEAENYHYMEGTYPYLLEEDELASNGKYMVQHDGTVPNGQGYMEYNVKITTAGIYKLWIRNKVHYTVTSNGAADSCYFMIWKDGTRIYNFTVNGVSVDWGWRTVATNLDLSEGEYVFRWANREDGNCYDKFIITTDLDYIPTGIEFEESSIENDYKIRFDINGNLICKDYTEVADSLLKLSNGVVSIGDIVENYDFTFKPLSMEGIQAYFDASVLNVGNVPIWEDLTGNGNNLVASSNPPVVIPSSLNGLNTLAFDATPMVFPSTFKIQPNASIYMIVKSNSAGGALQTIMGTQGITAVTAPRFYIAYHNSYMMRTQGRQTSSGVSIQDDFVVFGVRHNEVGDMVLQVNETIVEAAGHITEYNDEVVQFGFSSYRGFKGEVGELIIFNRMLNDKEHNALYGYLREKWGV